MLETCSAFVIARSDSHAGSLEKISRRLGLETVFQINSRRAFSSLETDQPIAFFLIHHQLDESLMRAILKAIRSNEVDRVRYAPIMLFLDDCPFETYLRYVHMGFDDALALPDKRDVLVQRLEGQLLAPHLYVSTPSYFGPDRRRFDVGGPQDERRGKGSHWHEEITFVRHPADGIKVIKRQSVFERDGRRHEA